MVSRPMSQIQRKLADLSRQASGTKRGGSRIFLPNRESQFSAKLSHLSETRVFASLPSAEKTWLAENTTMVTCERGRVFYTPDEPGEVIFIVKRGRVDLYRLGLDGRKLVVATLEDHTIFGEMGLIGQRMYGCFAEAATDCLLCVLSRSDLSRLIRRNPEVGLALLTEVSDRLQQREADLEALAFRALPNRLATLLLREADHFGTIDGYTHQDLAERLGTYRETVSQVLGRFRNEHLVLVEHRRIRITDPEGLQAYVDEL
jgi:CRP/FNR family cyclic AMP-dependent transcriptional regulator